MGDYRKYWWVLLLLAFVFAEYYDDWSPQARACKQAGGKLLYDACVTLVPIDAYKGPHK